MHKKSKSVMEKITELTPWMLDMHGMKSGLLTIVAPHGRLRYPSGSMTIYWKAECECGNTHIVNANKFNRGEIRSCGCLAVRNSQEALKDLKGKVHTPKELNSSGHRYDWLYDKVFDRLTVTDLSHAVSYIINGKRTETKWNIYWNCECSCGKLITRTARYLKSEGIKSCGCAGVKARNLRRIAKVHHG